MMEISQEMIQIATFNISLKITKSRLQRHLPVANAIMRKMVKLKKRSPWEDKRNNGVLNWHVQ